MKPIKYFRIKGSSDLAKQLYIETSKVNSQVEIFSSSSGEYIRSEQTTQRRRQPLTTGLATMIHKRLQYYWAWLSCQGCRPTATLAVQLDSSVSIGCRPVQVTEPLRQKQRIVSSRLDCSASIELKTVNWRHRYAYNRDGHHLETKVSKRNVAYLL